MEDLDTNELLPDDELDAMDNSLDSMIDTFEDIKEHIDNALNVYRRNNLSIYRGGSSKSTAGAWREIQISVSGIDVWRRVIVPESYTLQKLHIMIQACLDWRNSSLYQFTHKNQNNTHERERLDEDAEIGGLCDKGIRELLYEYGTKWTLKVIVLSNYEPGKDEAVRCVAGEGAPPPEAIAGPLRFRRILSVLENGNDAEKRLVMEELGPGFVSGYFDVEKCNRNINSAYLEGKK
jgi:hypothetical protein